uniref:NS3 protein n=1 Tax=Jingmen tick virus TaxID=1172985 RepID=A0A7S9PR43_9FLAV|nr:NS3 protein [Jingmen tick virus]
MFYPQLILSAFVMDILINDPGVYTYEKVLAMLISVWFEKMRITNRKRGFLTDFKELILFYAMFHRAGLVIDCFEVFATSYFGVFNVKEIISKNKDKRMVVRAGKAQWMKDKFLKNTSKHGVLSLLRTIPGSEMIYNTYVEFVCPIDEVKEALVSFDGLDNVNDAKEKLRSELGIAHNKNFLMMLLGIGFVLTLMGINFALAFVILMAGTFMLSQGPDYGKNDITGDKVKGNVTNTPDGCYRIYTRIFGYTYVCGTGYLTEGVFHTRLHVTGDTPLEIGGVKFQPSHIIEEADYITWGGAPKFVRTEDGERCIVYVVMHECNTPFVYESALTKWKDEKFDIMVGTKTRAGASGSPVFVLRTETVCDVDGKTTTNERLRLAGLIGENLTTSSEWFSQQTHKSQIEVMHDIGISGTDSSPTLRAGDYYQIFDHPGSGKTRVTIPSLVAQGKQFCSHVYVSPPTRAICVELHRALSEHNPTLSIRGAVNVKNYTKESRVTIIPHASLLRMMVTGSGRFRDDYGYIIDESHFCDSSTIILKDLIKERVSRGRKGFGVELTATGRDDKGRVYVNEGSIHKITEEVIERSAYLNRIVQEADKVRGRKIVVFCPSVSSSLKHIGTVQNVFNTLKNKLKDKIDIVQFHRSLFNQNYDEAVGPPKNGKTKVVLTTNMSECGINFNADVVLDSSNQLRFIEEENIMKMVITPITMAQRVQRRGRVGRRKEGLYIRVNETVTEDLTYPKQAEEIDAEFFRRAMGMQSKTSSTLADRYTVTQEQIKKWLTDDTLNSPLSATLKYTASGLLRSPIQLRAAIEEWMEGNEIITLSKSTETVRCKWFDFRDARYLFSLIRTMKPEVPLTEGKEYEEEYEEPIQKVISLQSVRGYMSSMKRPTETLVEDLFGNTWGLHPTARRITITRGPLGGNVIKEGEDIDDRNEERDDDPFDDPIEPDEVL